MRIGTGRRWWTGGLAALAMGYAASFALVAEELSPAVAVRIGVVGSLFRDTPEPMVQVLMKPLKSLLECQTGIRGTMVEAGDAANLGNQLADDKVQLGVFHGFEFAWARQKHPELKPLIIALTPPSCARAHLMVRKNAGYKALADLKGKTLAMPQRTREHCHLFIERRCQDAGDSPAKFFAQLTTPADFEDALDGVVDGTVQATLVDGAALDTYAQRKPGRAARLSTLIESETFPPAVVACNPSNLDEATQRRFRDGMINSAQTRKGQQLLTICRITGFDRTPDGYDRDLQTILKAYPPTAAK